MTSVRTHLWFGNDKAVEAANFYADHIPNSAVSRVVTARTEPDNEVAEDVVVIEIVDDAGHPVPPGRPGAQVLLTNLINYAQPLIRYELSDSVVESPSPNPAGRPWRCLLSVDGRTADILYLPGPGGSTVAVHPSVLGSAVAPIVEVGGVRIHTRRARAARSGRARSRSFGRRPRPAARRIGCCHRLDWCPTACG